MNRNTPLEDWQTANPIMWREALSVPEGGFIPEAIEMLFAKFGDGKTSRLQTWERPKEDRNAPHWIAVRTGTPMHVDPLYPRFTHQLVVYNDGLGVVGRAGARGEPLAAGTLFCCDTHSPHQVVKDPRLGLGLHYLAVSWDSHEMLDPTIARERLLAFVLRRARGRRMKA